jgi:hypothetical protein
VTDMRPPMALGDGTHPRRFVRYYLRLRIAMVSAR